MELGIYAMKKVGRTHSVIHVHRWVLWWAYVGIACGIVALVNIIFRHLTHAQENVILILGVVNWAMGGLICWATEGIRVEKESSLGPPRKPAPPARILPDHEWHSASEFRLPGNAHLFLRFPYQQTSREPFDHYRRIRLRPRQNHHAA